MLNVENQILEKRKWWQNLIIILSSTHLTALILSMELVIVLRFYCKNVEIMNRRCYWAAHWHLDEVIVHNNPTFPWCFAVFSALLTACWLCNKVGRYSWWAIFVTDERIGTLLFVVNNAEELPKVRSQLVTIVRRTWSNPPSHGARVVATVLNNPQLYHEW